MTLVVIDMQPGFIASRDQHILRAVEREIREACDRRDAIIFLEYWDRDLDSGQEWCEEGFTHKRLMDLAAGEQPMAVARKFTDVGSLEVIETCRREGFDLRHLRIAGVNTDGCVLATVQGLVAALPSSIVEVVRNACNCDCACGGKEWHRFPSSAVIC